MISFNEILEAYTFLRTNNHTIPSEVIEFMKDSAIEKLREMIYENSPEDPEIIFEELDFGDLIALEDMKYFSPSDGSGLLATNTQQSNIPLNFHELYRIKEKYPWCTHIQWYNK